MDQIQKNRISIQVSLSGYSFKIENEEGVRSSEWLGADRVFTTPEFQARYEEVSISLFTPKCALVPEQFFIPGKERESLAEVVGLKDGDAVDSVPVKAFGAVLLYSNSIGESLSPLISRAVLKVDGQSSPVLPELYWLLESVPLCTEYNRILASYRDGYLHLVISQGKSLLLANVYKAMDFTTAEYFIFLAMKTLQLNPEVSTIRWRTPLTNAEEMSLYRYFASVESI